FHATPPTELYTLSLHDALPIYGHGCFAHDLQNTCSVFRIDLLAIKVQGKPFGFEVGLYRFAALHFRRCLGQCMHDRLLVEIAHRSEEYTSELQSRENLVCRLLL